MVMSDSASLLIKLQNVLGTVEDPSKIETSLTGIAHILYVKDLLLSKPHMKALMKRYLETSCSACREGLSLCGQRCSWIELKRSAVGVEDQGSQFDLYTSARQKRTRSECECRSRAVRVTYQGKRLL